MASRIHRFTGNVPEHCALLALHQRLHASYAEKLDKKYNDDSKGWNRRLQAPVCADDVETTTEEVTHDSCLGHGEAGHTHPVKATTTTFVPAG